MLSLKLVKLDTLIKGKKYFLVGFDDEYFVAEWTGQYFDDNFQICDEPDQFREIYLIEKTNESL